MGTDESGFIERLHYKNLYALQAKFYEGLAMVEEDVKIELGYTLDDIMIDCMYAGADCQLKR